MGLIDKARQTAEQARAGVLGERPLAASDPEGGESEAVPPPPPSGRAGAAFSAFVERINPGLLADLIIHATAAQEKTNKALKTKGSQYRISEMYLTASIPLRSGSTSPASATRTTTPLRSIRCRSRTLWRRSQLLGQQVHE